MATTVRPYRPADAAACCEVINTAVAGMAGLNDAARLLVRSKNVPDALDADLRRWFTLVVLAAGRVVGVGALDGAKIKRLYVAPDAQGTGAGGALLEALEAESAARGHPEVTVEASPSSVQFYRRRGYAPVDDGRLEVGPAVFEFTTMRRLTGQ